MPSIQAVEGASLKPDVLVGWHHAGIHAHQTVKHVVLDGRDGSVASASLVPVGASVGITKDASERQRLWNVTFRNTDLEPVVELLHLVCRGLEEPTNRMIFFVHSFFRTSEPSLCIWDFCPGSKQRGLKGILATRSLELKF